MKQHLKSILHTIYTYCVEINRVEVSVSNIPLQPISARVEY